MGSKYDAFWRARTEAVAELMDRAAAGEVAEMDVSGIRHLGNRGSWSGIARVRADGTVDGQMAHMVALARLLLGTVTPDLAYIVEVERLKSKVGGREDVVPVNLRVTSIFRREDGRWRLVHRHADPITTVQPAESVLQKS